jgi:hypothetical protein
VARARGEAGSLDPDQQNFEEVFIHRAIFLIVNKNEMKSNRNKNQAPYYPFMLCYHLMIKIWTGKKKKTLFAHFLPFLLFF